MSWVKCISYSFSYKYQQTKLKGNHGKTGNSEPWGVEIGLALG
jgi:hypothetical protein